MAKAHDAFRTISEVSDALDTPTHVLRFWESKFNQIKPVKRAGGRRYYRPDDLALLAGIKDLLHEQGMTIKGAQKLLREKGVKYAVALGQNRLDGVAGNDAAEIIDITPSVPAGTDENVEAIIAKEATAPAAAATPQATLFSAPSAASPVVPAEAKSEPESVPEAVSEAEAEPDVTSDDPAPSIVAAVQDTLADEPEDTTNIFESSPADDAEPGPAATPAPRPTFPAIAEARDMPPRLLAALHKADGAKLRAQAGQIAPLVARLETVRDQLRRV